MQYDVIINRESGTGLFKEEEPRTRLSKVFSDRGHKVKIHVVPPAELEAALKTSAEGSADALLLGGGDGTVRTAAGFLRGTEKVLGVLPLGTFNLEARSLDIELDPFEAATQLMDADVVDIDLLTLNDHICLCNSVIGFYPTLAESQESYHGRSWWVKIFRMIRDLATVAIRTPILDLQITVDGETLRRRTRLAAFSPGKYEESIGLIPDRDDLASGKLTAYISSHLTRPKMLGAAIKFLTGKLFDTEGMTDIESAVITINVARRKHIPAMIDGEIVRLDMPCKLTILPKVLKVLRPRTPAS